MNVEGEIVPVVRVLRRMRCYAQPLVSVVVMMVKVECPICEGKGCKYCEGGKIITPIVTHPIV